MVAVVLIAFVAVAYTAVEDKSLPPEAAAVVAILRDDLHHSQSMNHMSFPKSVHMHKSLCLHAPQIDKMNNIGLIDLTPSSTCSYILCVGAHRLDICDTMVCCHNLVGLAPQIADNSIK